MEGQSNQVVLHVIGTCVCVHACVRVCMRMHVCGVGGCACLPVCMHECVRSFFIQLPRLSDTTNTFNNHILSMGYREPSTLPNHSQFIFFKESHP